MRERIQTESMLPQSDTLSQTSDDLETAHTARVQPVAVPVWTVWLKLRDLEERVGSCLHAVGRGPLARGSSFEGAWPARGDGRLGPCPPQIRWRKMRCGSEEIGEAELQMKPRAPTGVLKRAEEAKERLRLVVEEEF